MPSVRDDRGDRRDRRLLALSTVIGAFASALGFARFGLRPWQALPLGLGVQLAIYLAARAITRR